MIESIQLYKTKPVKTVVVICPIEPNEYAGWHSQISAFIQRKFDSYNFLTLYRTRCELNKRSFIRLWTDFSYAIGCWRSIVKISDICVIFPVFFLPSLFVSFLLPFLRCPYIVRISGGEISGGNVIAHWLRRKMILRAHGVVALNSIDRSRLVEMGVSPDRVVCIRNPVKKIFRPPTSIERQLARKALGITSDLRPVIGVIGTLCKRKAQLDLVRAVGMLDRADPVVVLCGPTGGHSEADSDYALMCREVASTLGLDLKLIEFVIDVRPVLWSLDIFVLASLSEGMPNALLEAMACGIPCIGSDIPGIRDVLEDSEYGLLVPAGDQEKLAQAIQYYLQEPIKAKAFGRAAAEVIVQQFQPEQADAAYLEMIKGLFHEAS
jgi:glycosyltransferase involved in cell wall biosynthesis